MPHGYISRRRTGLFAANTVLYTYAFQSRSQQSLDQGDVAVAVIADVELGGVTVGIKHADLHHRHASGETKTAGMSIRSGSQPASASPPRPDERDGASPAVTKAFHLRACAKKRIVVKSALPCPPWRGNQPQRVTPPAATPFVGRR